MARKRLFGSKGPLIYATIVSLICVMSASISTFAWFQAEANVQVQTTSSYATISVTKPEDLRVEPTIYASKSNYTLSQGTYTNHGYTSTLSNVNIANNNHFLPLTTTQLKQALLETSSIAPGHKLTFAIKAHGNRGISSASFSIEKYTSIRLMNRHKLSNSSTDSGYPIAIDESVNIYTTINSTGIYTENSTNKFSFNYATTVNSQTLDVTGGNIQTNVYDSSAQSNPYAGTDLGTNANLSGQDVYFFFTIKFLNTAVYQEYTGLSGSAMTIPNVDYTHTTVLNNYYKYYENTGGSYSYANPQPTTQGELNASAYYIPTDRFFLSGSGDSNCYAGLSFQINHIKLSLI